MSDDHVTPLPPLHLIICRESHRGLAGELANALRTALRGNTENQDVYLATLSDLPLPTRDFSSCPTHLDPSEFLDQALHTLVVVLIDAELQSNSKWESWLERCDGHVDRSRGRHRLLELCLDESSRQAIPARSKVAEVIGYDDLQEDSKFAFGEHAERPAWFALYVLQHCRHLLAPAVFGTDEPEKLKLRIFLSHAKKDSLPLANSVRYALEKKSFFSSWYDAVDLEGVDDWRTAIQEGVQSSVVVVLRTEQYDHRPWCRQEFLWAEQCGVPIVCVEARNTLEYQADYLATSRVPTVRIPDGNLFRVLFLALKESLRILRLDRIKTDLSENHEGFKQAREIHLIPYTPDLRHLTHAGQSIRERVTPNSSGYHIILYADPPLTPELYQAAKDYLDKICGRTYLLTPTLLPFWRVQSDPGSGTTRSLQNQSPVSISVSENLPDLKRLGFAHPDVNDVTVQIAQSVIANEGQVAFGHDWRPGGVMQAIYRFAEEHQEVVLNEKDRRGLIRNYLFWGAIPGLSSREIQHLRGVLDIVRCPGPEDLGSKIVDSLDQLSPPLRDYARARSLTTMRRKMTADTLARICIGGRDMDPRRPELGPSGRCPGVVEEALLSCQANQPLYLSGLLGGVTAQVIAAFENRPARLDFNLPEPVAEFYGPEPDGFDHLLEPNYEGPLASDSLLAFFREYGINRLSQFNRLSPEENRQLFHAATVEQARDLILTGLSRLLD